VSTKFTHHSLSSKQAERDHIQHFQVTLSRVT
jgi:hypothetical protein